MARRRQANPPAPRAEARPPAQSRTASEETEETLRLEVKRLRDEREIAAARVGPFREGDTATPAQRFAFVEREKANHSVQVLCQVLGVSLSGYYAWRKRGQSAHAQQDEVLTARIEALYQESGHTYGAPRIHAALQAAGISCGRKRVARLMREAGLVGSGHRKTAEGAVD